MSNNSNRKKEWGNIDKKKKKKNYKKTSSKNNEKKKSYKISENDFPSLNDNKFTITNTNSYSSLAWRKKPTNIVKTNNIYNKAKNGSMILNSFPVLENSPEFPLFQ